MRQNYRPQNPACFPGKSCQQLMGSVKCWYLSSCFRPHMYSFIYHPNAISSFFMLNSPTSWTHTLTPAALFLQRREGKWSLKKQLPNGESKSSYWWNTTRHIKEERRKCRLHSLTLVLCYTICLIFKVLFEHWLFNATPIPICPRIYATETTNETGRFVTIVFSWEFKNWCYCNADTYLLS